MGLCRGAGFGKRDDHEEAAQSARDKRDRDRHHEGVLRAAEDCLPGLRLGANAAPGAKAGGRGL